MGGNGSTSDRAPDVSNHAARDLQGPVAKDRWKVCVLSWRIQSTTISPTYAFTLSFQTPVRLLTRPSGLGKRPKFLEMEASFLSMGLFGLMTQSDLLLRIPLITKQELQEMNGYGKRM